MNKIKFMGIMIVIFTVGFAAGMISEKILSGNIEKSNDNDIKDYSNDISDFIGTWSASEYLHNESEEITIYYTWSFFENRTVHTVIDAKNETSNKTIAKSWYKFDVTEDELEIEASTGAALQYAFSFSDDKNELTLSKDGQPMTFHKS